MVHFVDDIQFFSVACQIDEMHHHGWVEIALHVVEAEADIMAELDAW